jgi:CTP:phosphocholine cytidylyltransferase-like protein
VCSIIGFVAYDKYQNESDRYSVYTTADKNSAVVVSDGEIYLVPKDFASSYRDSGTVMTYQEDWSNDDNNEDVVTILVLVIGGLAVLIIVGMCLHQEREVNRMEEEWYK